MLMATYFRQGHVIRDDGSQEKYSPPDHITNISGGQKIARELNLELAFVMQVLENEERKNES